MTSLLTRYRERMQHEHGWQVELACPTCGTVAIPAFDGWAPNRAMNFGETPTIYADLRCPKCGEGLRDVAGRKLVELFADVAIPPKNRRLLISFVVFVLASEPGRIALSLLAGWRELGGFLMRGPLLLIVPSAMWLNWQVASIRCRCACGDPRSLFMGLLGRSYCYRCSTCGRLLRLRD